MIRWLSFALFSTAVIGNDEVREQDYNSESPSSKNIVIDNMGENPVICEGKVVYCRIIDNIPYYKPAYYTADRGTQKKVEDRVDKIIGNRELR